jgi:hypothetical protein
MRRIVSIVLGLMLLPAGGCALVSWATAVTSPPNSIPPKYQIPKGAKVLVLVDDPQRLAVGTAVRQEITRKTNEHLLEHEVAADVVAQKIIMQTASVTPGWSQMRAVEIGRMFEADYVIQVDIQEFQLKEDPVGPIWKGRLAATVRVYSCQEGRVWPMDRPDGFPVTPATTKTNEDFSPDYGERLSVHLARVTADRIAKLFYAHPGREHYELPPEGTAEL